MSLFLKRLSTTLSLCAALLAPAFAATTNNTHPQISVRPTARITEAVDTKKLTTLTGSHPSRLDGMTDMGRVSTGTQFNHMLLVLKSSDAQEFALQALLDQQQDRSHANFHQWATPDTFGAAFGVESSDIDQVKAWLQQSGFTVNSVSKSGRLIDFSGTSGAVESAFHTEMHQYQVNGETRMSNTTDVSIPSALTTVVVGPARLNNFRPTSYSVGARKATIGKNGKVTSATALATGRTPLWSDGAGDNFVGAADLQVIYDAAPMYAKGIDGTGVTIGLIGQTDILPQDDQMYRSIFGLPPNPVTRIQVGDDPGTIPDDVESDLDVELAGSLGYNANIEFITSGNSTVGGGTDSSAVYLVDQNAVDIMSYSYGGCEADYTAASTGGPNINALYNTLWEQAAAQGQSVFVSTGDSGADVCADGRTSATPTGYSVNGLASTPYDVAVGGTEFNESLDTSGATFWGGPSLAIPFESAMSYIPEVPWDESAYGITPFIGTTTLDTEGGGLTAESSGISFFYGTPSWQTGPGVPTTDPTPTEGSIPSTSYAVAGPHRYLPDVSANAAVYQDPTMFCSEGICQLNADGTLANAGLVGGTSVAAPTMASVQALINQANGGRQGQPNYYYYRIAAVQKAAACDSNTYITTVAAACGFHDVVTGNNNTPSARNAAPPSLSYIGWNAGAGYDMAVGLGSPDVAQLSAAWSTVTFHATTTSFTLTPTTGNHGIAYTIAVKVSPVSGTGTPSGQFSVIASALTGNGVGAYTLSNGAYNGTITGLPGGTYNVYVHYGGDTTFGGSNSAPVQVTVGTETPTITAATYLVSTAGAVTAATAFSYGTNVFINAGLNSPSGVGTPTGNVTFTLNNGTTTLPTLAVPLDPNQEYPLPGMTTVYKADAYLNAGLGLTADDYQPNYSVLAPGTYTATVTYPGDNTFNSATSNTATFTVGLATTTFTLTAATTEVTSGGTAIIDAAVTQIAAAAGGAVPNGTVTFTDTTTSTSLGTCTLTAGACAFSTKLLTTSGAHVISGVYSGDPNYGTSTKTATVTVGGTGTVILLVPSTTAAQVGTTVVLTATVPAGSTGKVYFFDGGAPLGNATISTTTNTAVLNEAAFTAASHVITATYAGSATIASATSTAVTVKMSQNTPSVALSVENNNTTAASANTSYGAVLTPSPQNAAPMNPAPTGNVSFKDGTGTSAVVLGSTPFVYESGYTDYYVANVTGPKLAPGYHTITASYAGDVNYAGIVSSAQTLGIGITTTSLAITSSGSGSGATITVTATVAPVVTPQTPALTGTVSFYKNTVSTATLISKQPVSSGTASVSLAYPTTQTAVIAVYSGDANYYTSQSTTTTIAGYVISVNPTSTSMSAKGSTTVTVTATSYGGYTGTGSLSCSGLPANTFCPYNNVAQWTFSGVDGAQPISLTITALNAQGISTPAHAGFLWLPAMLLAGLLAFGRKRLTVRGRQLLALAVLFCGMMAVNGCSGGNDYSKVTTPTGSYNVTLVSNGTGANASSPNLTTTAALTLQVQ